MKKPLTKELDTVSVAITEHYNQIGKNNMKISAILTEKYQYEFKQAYLKNDQKISKKMEFIKEVNLQKYIINNRKSEYRIKHTQTRKSSQYNTR